MKKHFPTDVSKTFSVILWGVVAVHYLYYLPLILQQITFPWFHKAYDAGDRFGFNLFGWYFYVLIFIALNYVFAVLKKKSWRRYVVIPLYILEFATLSLFLSRSLGLGMIGMGILALQIFLIERRPNYILPFFLLCFLPLWFMKFKNPSYNQIWSRSYPDEWINGG